MKMTVQTPYEIIENYDDIEIRQYPKFLLAVVRDYQESSAFNILFQYIFGNNSSRRKIPMTAAVISSEKIAMTTPVITSADSMDFILPSEYTY